MSSKDEKVIFVPLKEIATSAKGKKPAVLERENRAGYLPYIDIEAFEKGVFKQFTKPEKIVSSDEGDVLMVWDGSRSGFVGRGRKGALGSTLAKIDVPLVEKTYLFHFLEALYPKINSRAKGVGIPHVDPDLLWSSQFPVVSQKQQHLIVEKIEELLSEVEASIKELESAQKKLKLYRASALNAACSGKLVPTEAELAKKESRSYETGAELLTRILKERREKWNGRGKYKEPVASDDIKLPLLPSGYVWATVGQVASSDSNSITDGPFGSNLKTEHYCKVGPRVIRLQNIGDGVYVDAEAHISQAHFERLQKHRVFAGDVVIAGFGESLPRSCIIPESFGPGIVKADCIRFKPHQDILPQYVNIALNSELVRGRTKVMIHGVGRPRLNLGEIKSIPIPIPPAAEQRRIVDEAERRLSILEEVEKVLTTNKARANSLRQSILEQAFSGKLVPQDPHDEPASVLLEKIKAEREKAVSAKKALPKVFRGRKRVKQA